MTKAAPLMELLAPTMAPTGTTVRGEGRVLVVNRVMVRVQAACEMGLTGVLSLVLGMELS